MQKKKDSAKQLSLNKKNTVRMIVAIIFWIIVWQAASEWIGEEILLASPLRVCETLLELLPTAAFWKTVAVSFGRIISGFMIAMITGVLLAVLAAISSTIRTLLAPMMLLIKAVPVASFIILVLLVSKAASDLFAGCTAVFFQCMQYQYWAWLQKRYCCRSDWLTRRQYWRASVSGQNTSFHRRGARMDDRDRHFKCLL